MSADHIEYYQQRAIAERKMAKAAARLDVREIHEELARQYEALVERAELRSTLRIVVPSSDATESAG